MADQQLGSDLTARMSRRDLLHALAVAGVGISTTGLLGSLRAGSARAAGQRVPALQQAQPYAGQTLNVLMEDLLETTAIEELLPEFKEKTGIDVVFEKVQYGIMHEKLVPSLTSPPGEGSYDLLEVDFYWVGEFVAAGWMEKIGDRMKQEGMTMDPYIPAAVETNGRVRGEDWFLPMYPYPMGLIYRKDILGDQAVKDEFKARVGKDLDPSTLTLPEYAELAKMLKTADRYGAAMQGQRVDPITMEWSNYLYAMGGDYYDKDLTRPLINQPNAVKALEIYIDVMKNAAQPGAAGANLDDQAAIYGQGKAATMITFAQMVAWAEDPANSVVRGLSAITTTPGGTGLMGAWSWGIPKSSPHPDAAWEFIKWVESPDIAKRRAMRGGLPAQKAIYEDPEWQAKFPHYSTLGTLIAGAKGLPLITRQPQLVEIVGKELSEAVAGAKTPQQALDDAAKGLAELLA